MRRRTIEQSREIRQWIGLGLKTVSGFVTFDYWLNDGQMTKKFANNAKKKYGEVKEKIRIMKEKREGKIVDVEVLNTSENKEKV